MGTFSLISWEVSTCLYFPMLAAFLLEGYFATLHKFEEDQMNLNKEAKGYSNRDSIRVVLVGAVVVLAILSGRPRAWDVSMTVIEPLIPKLFCNFWSTRFSLVWVKLIPKYFLLLKRHLFLFYFYVSMHTFAHMHVIWLSACRSQKKASWEIVSHLMGC